MKVSTHPISPSLERIARTKNLINVFSHFCRKPNAKHDAVGIS